MRGTQRPYSQTDDEFIRANYLAMSSRVLGEHIGRTLDSVRSRLEKLRLRRFAIKNFSAAEDEVIRAGFGSRTSVDIGKQLGRDAAVIRQRAVNLGLGKWRKQTKVFRDYKVAHIEKLPNGKYRRVQEHRHVMQEHLGRSLADTERVHHINCQKRDNRIENLHLFASDAAHHKAHHSVTKLIAGLLERGAIYFDRDAGIYRLCETNN